MIACSCSKYWSLKLLWLIKFKLVINWWLWQTLSLKSKWRAHRTPCHLIFCQECSWLLKDKNFSHMPVPTHGIWMASHICTSHNGKVCSSLEYRQRSSWPYHLVAAAATLMLNEWVSEFHISLLSLGVNYYRNHPITIFLPSMEINRRDKKKWRDMPKFWNAGHWK